MSDFDPLQSPALHKMFPSLSVAFDGTAVREHLQTALFGPHQRRYLVTDCELDEAMYLPGDCCLLRYKLGIQERDGGEQRSAMVSGRVFPHAQDAHEYVCSRLSPFAPVLAGREDLAPFACSAAAIDSLQMAAYVFPLDADLPGLAVATDSRQMSIVFDESLPDSLRRGVRTEDCRIELVVYRRQHRAVLRYSLNKKTGSGGLPQSLVLYGKMAADSSGGRAVALTRALREHIGRSASAYRFHVPAAIVWRPDLKFTLFESVSGGGGLHRTLKARLRDRPLPPGELSLDGMVETFARIARTLHGSGVRAGVCRTLADEVEELTAQLNEVRRVSPELGLRLNGWLQQLQGRDRSSEMESRLCHGDFTPGQVVFDGTESGLLDYDSVCQAEPALDLGQFIAYLRNACTKAAGTASLTAKELAQQLGQRFLSAYSAASPDRIDAGDLAARVETYTIVSHLRRAIHSWHKFKPGRVQAAIAALEEGCGPCH